MKNDLRKFFSSKLVSQLIFYPRKSEKPKRDTDFEKYLIFTMDDGVKLGGIFFHKQKSLPTLILFHGNGELAEDYRYNAQNFHECEVNLLVIDYRGYGFSKGKSTFVNLIRDTLPCFNQAQEWLENNSYNTDIFVLGRSLGSVCAAELGSHNPNGLKGLIFESGFSDTYQLMLDLFKIKIPGVTEKKMKAWSNATRIECIKHPALVIHGTLDQVIPFSHGKAIFNTLPQDTWKQFVRIEGAGHNDIFTFRDIYFGECKKFITKFKSR
ncbi:MAG: prolyl oligopeptidase family serine peptidase [Asgard group archaeon]|nr:prolyl oligopeptidase family serine peptidase [Asgard group archaeon]